MDAEDSRSALRGLASQLSAPEFSSRARGTHVREAYAGGGVGMAAAGDSLARILDMMTRLSADLAANGGAAAGAEAAGAEAGALSGSPGALPSAPPGALPGALPVLGAPPLSAAGAAEAATDEVLRAMMGEYERMGSKEDFGAAVDGVMRQLLTRELMYEPIRRLCESFPEWLASNAPSLVVEQYESHGRQYQVLQQLAATYESEPDNFPRLMELMQDLQALGQLPAQLLRCAAPGLELTAEGLPALALCAPADVAAAVPLGGCQVQ